MGNSESMWEPYRSSLYDRKPLDSGEAVRESIHDRARARRQPWSATQKQLGYVNGLLTKCFGTGDSGRVARHQFLEYVWGLPTSRGLSGSQASAIIDWARDPDGDGAHPAAAAEAWLVLKAWALDHGEEEMEL